MVNSNPSILLVVFLEVLRKVDDSLVEKLRKKLRLGF